MVLRMNYDVMAITVAGGTAKVLHDREKIFRGAVPRAKTDPEFFQTFEAGQLGFEYQRGTGELLAIKQGERKVYPIDG